jgi:hypothetical protein
MKLKELNSWKLALTDQQFLVLKRIFWRSQGFLWTRYRNLFEICNSPSKRVSEMVEAGVKFKYRDVQIKNSTGRKVVVREFQV